MRQHLSALASVDCRKYGNCRSVQGRPHHQAAGWGAAMGRGDLSDAAWELIGPLLPPERGRHARPAGDNRRFLNGMLHVLRVGCAWRDIHERYGKWNPVYVRFRRWAQQGVRVF